MRDWTIRFPPRCAPLPAGTAPIATTRPPSPWHNPSPGTAATRNSRFLPALPAAVQEIRRHPPETRSSTPPPCASAYQPNQPTLSGIGFQPFEKQRQRIRGAFRRPVFGYFGLQQTRECFAIVVLRTGVIDSCWNEPHTDRFDRWDGHFVYRSASTSLIPSSTSAMIAAGTVFALEVRTDLSIVMICDTFTTDG